MADEWVVPAGMFALMFGMGLTLTVQDFHRVVSLPRPTVVGTLLQLVGMPLAGLGVAYASGLPPLLAAGLVIVAACPGGAMSNVLVHLGKADTALSITLTATATAVTLFTLPLWVRAALACFDETGGAIAMPLLDTAVELGGFTILPVAMGMLGRRVRPTLAAREPWFTRAGAVAIVVALSVEAVRGGDPPVAEFAASSPAAAVLLAAALAMGLAAPRLARLDWRDTTTIAVELVIKNTMLGLFVATEALDSLVAAVPIAAFMAFQVPVGIGVLVCYNLWWRREPAAGSVA